MKFPPPLPPILLLLFVLLEKGEWHGWFALPRGRTDEAPPPSVQTKTDPNTPLALSTLMSQPLQRKRGVQRPLNLRMQSGFLWT